MKSILDATMTEAEEVLKRPCSLMLRTRVITVQPSARSRLVFLTDPSGLAVEQYRLLRRRLCGLHSDGGVVSITSPNPGEGKTLTSINLAWCLADSGQSTCLVDLDFRAPGVGATLGYKFDTDGVEDVLTGKSSVLESLRRVGERPLYVLGVRQRLVSPAGLLSAASLGPVLGELRIMFDWVIVDLAPAIPMADVAEVIPSRRPARCWSCVPARPRRTSSASQSRCWGRSCGAWY